jgi:predicted transcriptional regulator
MEDIILGVIEGRFADIIWKNEPIRSGDLVKICAEELGWKKATTYNILKKLCLRGLFVNEDSIVRSVISREEFYGKHSSNIVDRSYHGSLPEFMAAFASVRKPDKKDVDIIKKLLKEWEN